MLLLQTVFPPHMKSYVILEKAIAHEKNYNSIKKMKKKCVIYNNFENFDNLIKKNE